MRGQPLQAHRLLARSTTPAVVLQGWWVQPQQAVESQHMVPVQKQQLQFSYYCKTAQLHAATVCRGFVPARWRVCLQACARKQLVTPGPGLVQQCTWLLRFTELMRSCILQIICAELVDSFKQLLHNGQTTRVRVALAGEPGGGAAEAPAPSEASSSLTNTATKKQQASRMAGRLRASQAWFRNRHVCTIPDTVRSAPKATQNTHVECNRKPNKICSTCSGYTHQSCLGPCTVCRDDTFKRGLSITIESFVSQDKCWSCSSCVAIKSLQVPCFS